MIKEALFYEDNYMKEFEAIVQECVSEKDYFKIVLDNTAFYSEGGGQPADTGFINDVEVFDTQEEGGKIYHFVKFPIEEGKSVKCKIDFEKRFINMQLHTAEHIVSGIICKKYGASNVGFHIGSDLVTLDFNKEINPKYMHEIECRANQAVYEHIDVNIKLYDNDEVKNIDYRSKKDLTGDVRIVKIGNYDICACCGVHVSNTSEIGIIKIIKCEKYKSGVRISMLAGNKAISDYDLRYNQVNDISTKLSLKLDEVTIGVDNLLNEINLLKRERNQLNSKLIDMELEKLDKSKVMIFETTNLEGNNMKNTCEKLLNKSEEIACVINENKFFIMSKEYDFSKDIINLRNNSVIRGGGKSKFFQGEILNEEDFENYINSLK